MNIYRRYSFELLVSIFFASLALSSGCVTRKIDPNRHTSKFTQEIWGTEFGAWIEPRWIEYSTCKPSYFSWGFVPWVPGKLKICYEPGCGRASFDILNESKNEITFRVNQMTTLPLNLATGEIQERIDAVGNIYKAKIKGSKVTSASAVDWTPDYKAENTPDFLRYNFQLEITNFTFGVALTNFAGAHSPSTNVYPEIRTRPGDDSGTVWYRTLLTDHHEKIFPRRTLRLGFKDDRLIAIHLWTGFHAERLQQVQTKQLGQAYEEAKAMGAKISSGGEWDLADEHLRIRSASICSPQEHFAAGLQITEPSPP